MLAHKFPGEGFQDLEEADTHEVLDSYSAELGDGHVTEGKVFRTNTVKKNGTPYFVPKTPFPVNLMGFEITLSRSVKSLCYTPIYPS
jgi:hypothetical protein